MALELSKYTAANVVHPLHPNSLICSILCPPAGYLRENVEYQCNVCGKVSEILYTNCYRDQFLPCNECNGWTFHRTRKEPS